MKKIKHTKLKNVSILFELLSRQLTVDTLNGVENSTALDLIKKYFSPKTELGKEYQLYFSLAKAKYPNEVKANTFIDAVTTSYKRLNKTKLKNEKYNLIKEIKNIYPVDDFFNSKLTNYKLYASIYKVFNFDNSSENVSPTELMTSKDTILENIVQTHNQSKPKDSFETSLEKYEKESKDIRILTYELLVEKFNEKYKDTLNENQKSLIKAYINNISNTNSLKEYIIAEIPKIKLQIESLLPYVGDDVIKIKVKETINQMDNIPNSKFITDTHVSSLMKYYSLISELKTLKGVK